MKYQVELNGLFEADINFWNGKAKLSYEGMELNEEGKNTFLLGNEKCVIGGSLFSGVYLCRGNDKALLVKLHWYDFLIGVLPFLVSLLGGMIGALLGVAGFFVCYKMMPYAKNFFLRLLICLLCAALILVIIVPVAAQFPHLFDLEVSDA